MRWFLHRLATSIVLAWAVATIVFLTLHVVPGDPAEILMSTGGVSPDPAAVAELRQRLGLERPLAEQYWDFLRKLVRGDLGTSLVDDYPGDQRDRLASAAHTGADRAATVLAVIVGLPAGTYAALNRGGLFDRVASATAALLLAVPVFVVGTLLVLLLAQTLRLMPAGGFVPFTQNPSQHLTVAGAAGHRHRQGACARWYSA